MQNPWGDLPPWYPPCSIGDTRLTAPFMIDAGWWGRHMTLLISVTQFVHSMLLKVILLLTEIGNAHILTRLDDYLSSLSPLRAQNVAFVFHKNTEVHYPTSTLLNTNLKILYHYQTTASRHTTNLSHRVEVTLLRNQHAKKCFDL